jgi:hypothetical protein
MRTLFIGAWFVVAIALVMAPSLAMAQGHDSSTARLMKPVKPDSKGEIDFAAVRADADAKARQHTDVDVKNKLNQKQKQNAIGIGKGGNSTVDVKNKSTNTNNNSLANTNTLTTGDIKNTLRTGDVNNVNVNQNKQIFGVPFGRELPIR